MMWWEEMKGDGYGITWADLALAQGPVPRVFTQGVTLCWLHITPLGYVVLRPFRTAVLHCPEGTADNSPVIYRGAWLSGFIQLLIFLHKNFFRNNIRLLAILVISNSECNRIGTRLFESMVN